MKGTHLRKVEARAARWAARLAPADPEQYGKPPREIIAHALRLTSWLRMPRVHGSLVEADDLIRIVVEDVPALVEEVRRQRARNDDLWARLTEARAASVEGPTHEEIVGRLHAAHREHLGWTEAELPVEECGHCAMYAEWVAPLLAGAGRATGESPDEDGDGDDDEQQ